MSPKVFISHASEDKERFVIDFAKKLRSRGVDAWLDRWEMLPGDSLVDKIFEEGIKNADAFIIVLSKNSVHKPWVREELNAGFVKRISKKAKIIPVVIDDCEIPECLKTTLWEKIDNLESYEENLERILQSIFGIAEKPPIGRPPKYVRTAIDILPELNKIDTLVFNAACNIMIAKGNKLINTSELYESIEELDISLELMMESIEILDSRGYIEAKRVLGGQIPFFMITYYGFDEFVRHNLQDYDLLVKEICLKILNENIKLNIEIAKEVNVPIVFVDHVLETLENRSLIKAIKALGGHYQVHYVSPELKRMFT